MAGMMRKSIKSMESNVIVPFYNKFPFIASVKKLAMVILIHLLSFCSSNFTIISTTAFSITKNRLVSRTDH